MPSFCRPHALRRKRTEAVRRQAAVAKPGNEKARGWDGEEELQSLAQGVSRFLFFCLAKKEGRGEGDSPPAYMTIGS